MLRVMETVTVTTELDAIEQRVAHGALTGVYEREDVERLLDIARSTEQRQTGLEREIRRLRASVEGLPELLLFSPQ